jgi:hypothetical protein
MAPDGRRPLLHRHKGCGHLFDPVMVCSECAAPLGPRDVVVEPGPRGRDDSPDDAADANTPSSKPRRRTPDATSPG